MKFVKIDQFEENGGEFALKDGDFLVILTGSNAGEYEHRLLPSFSETDKTLKEIFGENGIL